MLSIVRKKNELMSKREDNSITAFAKLLLGFFNLEVFRCTLISKATSLIQEITNDFSPE